MTAALPAVLHFSTADRSGGSARSAQRIHEGLRRLGHVSRMLVRTRESADADVDTVHAGRLGRLADRLADRVGESTGLQYLYQPSSHRVLRHRWLAEADVVQLYNTHGGYFSQWLLPALSRRVPVVWRLSDLWPITGHCAYPGDCERWRSGCGRCPDLASYPGVGVDATALLWRLKRRWYGRSDIAVVAPSSWTERLAGESPLFAGLPIHRIPNGIDTALYRPRPKGPLRELFGIGADETVLLFAAHALDGNSRKGGRLLVEALRRLGSRPGLRLLLLGAGGEAWRDRVPQPVTLAGFVQDQRLLAAAYALADVVAAPSELENLPNTVLEAMACGTPVVAADAGGMADAVRHLETGYLARHRDVDDLARGLALLLDDAELRRRCGAAARRLIEGEFEAGLEAQRFSQLYREVVARRAAAPRGATVAAHAG